MRGTRSTRSWGSQRLDSESTMSHEVDPVHRGPAARNQASESQTSHWPEGGDMRQEQPGQWNGLGA
ncbi:hypothetical protein EYF80_066921 [Liparis tanakae]|uniref:Uncharacterized protein n=1 Tax=Liparis tanakae TaxID=230148 RepID=A0A4Z2E2K5_9TELE|nr:hypothetical protein EYF80_066921 [Liparis tanakae]